jgi:hypothetical protein
MDEQGNREPTGGGIPQSIALMVVTGVLVAIIGLPSSSTTTSRTTATAPPPPPSTPAPPPVSVHGSTVLLRPAVATPPGAPHADLVAARNEFESFQVAVEGGDGRPGVGVAVAGDGLTGPGGATIPADDVTIYREAPYHVTFASDGEGEPGDWYDALIPERDPFYGEDRNAFPYDIPADAKLVSWIDVFVPEAAEGGTYRGRLLVTQDDGATTLATIPIRLRVLDFELPATTSLRSLTLSTPEFDPGIICRTFDGEECDPDADRGWLLSYLFSRAGLENRVTISNPAPVRTPAFDDPAQRELFDRFAGPLLDGEGHPPPDAGLLDARVRGAELTTIWAGLEEDCFDACLDGWRRLLGEPAFRNRFVYYACDEPGGDLAYWGECAARATEVAGEAPVLVTATLGEASAANATGYVDVLVPNVTQLVPAGETDPGAAYAEFAGVSPDRQFWLYSSCNSHGCGPDAACAYPESPTEATLGWPDYVIDEPPSQARAMPWIAYEYGATGELYYSATWSLDTAWIDQCVFGGNGEGNLFYAGRPDGYPGSTDSAIGGTTDIPIESLRLKRIRDGREDYEYLHELESRGEAAQAQAVVEALLGAPDVAARGATFSQEQLDEARCDLARLLEPSLRHCP